MIRIDEIYNNTFWPYLQARAPGTRMFYCDPPGETSPNNLFNHGACSDDHSFVFFHDQEPIHLDLHEPLFDDVDRRNEDLNRDRGPKHQIIVTSERDSDSLDQLCSQRGWQPQYYFFHGWAALDWYRGYDRTWLMPPPLQRNITHAWINPNRIIGGRRLHRVELMYHLIDVIDRPVYVSFPKVCPSERTDISTIGQELIDLYPDLVEKFSRLDLPFNMPGEVDHPMHSCWLSMFEQCRTSLAYVVTETVCYGRRHHLTEKIFKPICLRMPFVLVSTAGSLEYLRSYGFQTFHDIWDESYDTEPDDHQRIKKIGDLLKDLASLSVNELNSVMRGCHAILEHNYHHFYRGGFEKILGGEFDDLLTRLDLQLRC